MKNSWPEIPLANVTQFIQYGYTAKSSAAIAGPKYLRITDIQNAAVDWQTVPSVVIDSADLPRYRLSQGDIVFARSGATVGKSFLIREDPGEAVFASYLIRVKCEPNRLDPRYAAYFFQSEDYWRQIREGSTGTGQPNFNGTKLGQLHIPVPPLHQQRQIVLKLDRLFGHSNSAREELSRIPRLVERYKQAVLDKAFLGQLTSDWRISKDHPDASDLLKSIDVDPLHDQELPHLPQGWHWSTAGELCAIKSGLALGKKRKLGTALVEKPYLRVANVQRGWLDLSEIKTVLVTDKEAQALRLQSGDVLMNEGGDRDKLGRGWIWDGQISDCVHQNHVFRLRPRSEMLPSKYISYYANEFGRSYFLREGKQTTNLASISMTKLSGLPIPVAPPEEMELIVTLIESAFESIDAIAKEIAKASSLLYRLDQATLDKAFRGELLGEPEQAKETAA